MLPHLLKDKINLLALFFLICSIPSFAFAVDDKNPVKAVNDSDTYNKLGREHEESGNLSSLGSGLHLKLCSVSSPFKV